MNIFLVIIILYLSVNKKNYQILPFIISTQKFFHQGWGVGCCGWMVWHILVANGEFLIFQFKKFLINF